MLFTIFIFLVVLSILVVGHEFGHFIMARRAGMKVNEFGLGFPPRLFSWRDKRGTEWTVNLIPLGGFVKIQGENGEERHMPGSFGSASILARFLTLIGGVVMNVLMAWLLLTVVVGMGVQSVDGDQPVGGTVSDQAVTVIQVVDGSPAAKAGITVGDSIIQVDDVPVTDAESARSLLSEGEATHKVLLDHNGQRSTIFVTSEYLKEVDRAAVGVALVATATVRYPWYMAPVVGAQATWSLTAQTFMSFVDLLARLVHGTSSTAELSGPVGIATMTGQVARLGFGHLLQFAALLSINLAVLNALPFPALDGGRILFLFIEGVRRKPNSPNFEGIVHALGFVLLIGLVLFVTYKDVVRLLG